MFEVFQSYLERQISLTSEEISLFKSVLQPRKLKKGEFLLREGEISKHAAFVCRGFLRSYAVDNKGKEHIIQFAPENWWISEKGPMTDGSPSAIFIDAVEESDVLLVDFSGHMLLMERVPAFAAMFQQGIQKRSAAKDKRIVHSLAASADERYNDFLATYPSIAQRIPQHMLASYLGITPETLSRLRRRAMYKK